ncbi:NlpC/P60 family protein [Corynebacterium aurimucosum]|uniref:NlpC/P60 family protein n=1 Tax=Corynebacterium aurimucosum TaxID=169292 RepID=UPI00066D8DB6|nr:NlpC/P60 family protein [Corynebacterium aurimucosum]
MATIRLPRIRHVRAFFAAVVGTAAVSTLSTVAPAGADDSPADNTGVIQAHDSERAAIDRAVNNADSLQGAVEASRAELSRAEADVAEAEDRIARIQSQMEQVSDDPGANEEYLASLQGELDQADKDKRDAENRVVQERRELAQNEARLNATQRFAEATFARQQGAESQEVNSGLQLSQQDTLDTGLNPVNELDNQKTSDAFTVNSENLTEEIKPEAFTDEVVREGAPQVSAAPNASNDSEARGAINQGGTAPEAEFGNALNQGATPTFQNVDFTTGSSVNDALGLANDIAAAVDEDDVRTLMQGSSDLLGLGSPNTAPAASADAPGVDEVPESEGTTTGADAGSDAQIEAVIARAESQVGVPYVWGGGDNNGPTGGLRDGGVADSFGDFNKSGFDCSGLVKYAFAAAGLDLPHYTGAQYQQGKKVPRDNAKRGDLIFYGPGGSQHVAIYLGDGQMIEAPQSGQTVSVVPVRWGGATPDVVRLL